MAADHETGSSRAARRAALVTATVAAVVAAVVAVGWWTRLPALRNFGVGLTGTGPLTTALILVAAASCWAGARGAPRLARLGGAVVALVSVVVLIEWLLGVSPGIAHALAPDAVRAARNVRVSIPAAIIFCLLGLALAAFDRGRSALRPSDLLASVAAVFSFVVITAYAYGASTFVLFFGTPETGMALPTAIAQLALSLSVVLAEPERGLASIVLSDAPGASLARRVIVVAAFVPPLLGLLTSVGRWLGWVDTVAQLAMLTVLTSSIAIAAAVAAAGELRAIDARRRSAEASVHAAEALYRGLVAQAPDAILAVEDGAVVLPNACAARMFGRSEQSLTGVPVDELVPGIRTGACTPGPVELEIFGVSGRTSVEATCSVTSDGARRSTLILRDITERRRAELQIRRLAAIVESSSDAIIAADASGHIVAWNRAAERLYGWSAPEAIGHHLSITFPRDEAAVGEAVMTRLRRGERVEPFETERLRKDGSRFEAAITVSPITDATGEVVGFSGIARDITERRRLDAALRASEERFRALFEHASDGVFLADRDGRYVDVNEAGCRMLRTTRDRIVGARILDFIRAEQAPRLAEEREAVLRGEIVVSEYEMRRGDGEWATIEVSTRMLPDGRWVGLARDVSERRAAQDALRIAHDTERRLRRQIEAISDATTAVSDAVARLPHSDLVTVLQAIVLQAQAITGARYGALGIGSDPDRPFDPWVSLGVSEEVARAIGRTPRPRGLLGAVAVEGRTVRSDAVEEATEFGGFPPGHPPMHTFLGVPIRYQGVSIGNLYLSEKVDRTAFDADDQRAIEILADRVAVALETARLYESEARERSWLQTTIDHMPEPVLLADAQGRITSWNRAARPFFREDALLAARGVPFELRTPSGEQLAWEQHPIHHACERGALVTSVELLAIPRDGAPMPVLASAAPLAVEGAGTCGAVVVLRDISHLKELERLREQWTAVVAHDLRQPVSSIAISAQVLGKRRAHELSREDADLLRRIEGAAGRLRRMIDDLLDYAQIEAGHLRLVPRHVDLARLVAETVARIAPTTAGHEVRVEVHGGPADVDVDPDRIEQALTNLVTNAAKYGAPGSVIVVELDRRAGAIEIAVTNRGPGLQRDEIAQLFERFHRAPSAVASGVKGLGLGLFITRGIVEAHGGRIRVESTPGETTTFVLSLPAERHSQAA